jgi:hypothetical protein
MRGAVATVEEFMPGMMKVCSVAYPPISPVPPVNFLDIIRGWGQTWIWEDLKVTGGTNWIAQAIFKNSLVAMTDGFYIKEHYHDLCLAAFVLECTQEQGRVIGAIPEASAAANAYWGELLGLMAVHLLLLIFNAVSPGLSSRVKIYSESLGALSCIGQTPTVPCSYSMPALGHPEDNSSQLWWSFIPSEILPHQDTPRQLHSMGGLDLSGAAQCGVRCRSKGNALLPGHNRPPTARIFSTRTNLHVCRWKKADV